MTVKCHMAAMTDGTVAMMTIDRSIDRPTDLLSLDPPSVEFRVLWLRFPSPSSSRPRTRPASLQQQHVASMEVPPSHQAPTKTATHRPYRNPSLDRNSPTKILE
eukprot:GHVU01012068.1.p3 GENE.GHVU01012068.1~~GHVU01012068.1.p3  ORF type:complete len:104 (-),score=8.92 GHVU01012068.1:860-1171(-)